MADNVYSSAKILSKNENTEKYEIDKNEIYLMITK